MQLSMEHIPPVPPGMEAPIFKDSEIHRPTNHLRRKTASKKNRAHVESHEFWIGVCINNEGKPEIRSSSNTKQLRRQMNDIADCLLHLSQQSSQRQSTRIDNATDLQTRAFKSHPTGPNMTEWQGPHAIPPVPHLPNGSVSYLQPNRKRSRIDSQIFDGDGAGQSQVMSPMDHSSSVVSTYKQAPRRMLQIKYCESRKWEFWFANAFTAIQQQACRFIAKEWIKLIHPKKQSTHPYNGNFPRNQKASSDRTRPPYWPPDVIHKEPDHIDKEARTNLLVYLLMHTPQDEVTPATVEGGQPARKILAKDLLETLTKKKDELKDKWDIIETVIHMRSELEKYEEGGYDPETVESAPDYQENPRPGPNGKKQRVRSMNGVKSETREVLDDGDVTRAASPTTISSPTNYVATPDASDNEDDMSALNTSFTSNATQVSTCSTATPLQPKIDVTVTGHMHCNPRTSQHHPLLLDGSQPHANLGFIQHDPMHHKHPVMNTPWPTTSSADPRDFANMIMMPQPNTQPHVHMLDTAHYGHEIYSQSRPDHMNTVMALQHYHDQAQFPFDYDQDVNRNIPYRNIPDMDSNQSFLLPNEYCQVNPPHPQTHRH